MSWTNQSKNSSSFSNQSKTSSVFNSIHYLLCESGEPLVQENDFYILIADGAGDKHYSTYLNETKH